jgi:hypothetical protein
MPRQGNGRVDASDAIAKLRTHYAFTLREIAEYCRINPATLRTWQKDRWGVGFTAPAEPARDIKRMLRVAELLEAEGGMDSEGVWIWYKRRIQVGGAPVIRGKLVTQNYKRLRQQAKRHCERGGDSCQESETGCSPIGVGGLDWPKSATTALTRCK